ncbi:hypothetical protein A2773_00810 [Candidatus Gottesmanbacteria bacterium RIFCSPHIGHO2_01_FULL_39_10]|uniref:Uncharacterized protein n=1 Tax=Candidatus Gottesmanbacteria bacterium RIFCSPHIGHO2_01_FULL_39_10 TaxID=1798375 RepID=A0A1F5ZLR5_9BACT|nr:MAG: hypothetical protein A2773_00810 [Candidatus Gottesmanbacteria bacterium RIFCSPHIGHO2_01_FULL_39_10]
MIDGDPIPKFPGKTLIRHSESSAIKFPVGKTVEFVPTIDFSPFQKSWSLGEIGGTFEPNPDFNNPQQMITLIEGVTSELVQPDVRDRPHSITISCGQPIGREGVAETHIAEKSSIIVLPDRSGIGKQVKVAFRAAKPQTNLITYVVRPVEKNTDNPTFQITNAFPGESYPSSPDDPYWENHAYIIDAQTINLYKEKIKTLAQEHRKTTNLTRQAEIESEVGSLRTAVDEMSKLYLLYCADHPDLVRARISKMARMYNNTSDFNLQRKAELLQQVEEQKGKLSLLEQSGASSDPKMPNVIAERIIELADKYNRLSPDSPDRPKVIEELRRLQTVYDKIRQTNADEKRKSAEQQQKYLDQIPEAEKPEETLLRQVAFADKSVNVLASYAIAHGADATKLSHLSEVFDAQKYALVPGETLGRGVGGITRGKTNLVEIASEYVADPTVVVHESIHRAARISRDRYNRLPIKGQLAKYYYDMTGDTIEELSFRTDDPIVNLHGEDFAAAQEARILQFTEDTHKLNEAITQWATERIDGLKDTSGGQLEIPGKGQYYPYHVFAGDMLHELVMENRHCSSEEADSILITTALTSDYTELFSLVPKETMMGILAEIPSAVSDADVVLAVSNTST